jgi:hypothetical protein
VSPLLQEIAARADHVLSHGTRKDVTGLLALVAGLAAVAQQRLIELREEPTVSRVLTVKDAAAAYPVSRSFLYERGEALGLTHRTEHGKVVVRERALREYLEGTRA